MRKERKPTTRILIRRALIDAIEWQRSLACAYAHIPGSPERAKALSLVEAYQAILDRRYGSRSAPSAAPPAPPERDADG